MIFGAWRDGFARVVNAPAILAGVFVVTLAAALPLTLTLRDAMQAHLGASLIAADAADGVSYDWWQEFTSQTSGIGATFTPSVLGFATTLDSVSALLDRRAVIAPIALALAFYALVWMFLAGGIIDRYARGHRIGARGFFAAAGVFFFRFLRLGVIAAGVYACLFVYVHEWLFAKWYVAMTRDSAVEHIAFYWRALMYLIFTALLALTTTVFDYVRVRAVVEDRRSVIATLVAAVRFIARNPGRVAGLFFMNAALLLAIVAIWAAIAPGAGSTGLWMWIGVLATQGYIAARLMVKLQFIASEIALFQRSLAQWGYVAAPMAPAREPPIVEAL